jgi:hypothetical protein
MGNIVSGYQPKKRDTYEPAKVALTVDLSSSVSASRSKHQLDAKNSQGNVLLTVSAQNLERSGRGGNDRRGTSLGMSHSNHPNGDGEWMYNLGALQKQYEKRASGPHAPPAS